MNDRVMTDFLLGALEEPERERVFERLGTDETFFESMAALEEDLILRWHRGDLPPRERELFERAYAEPTRRARVDSSIALFQAAAAWKAKEAAGVWLRIAEWSRTPWTVPRLAFGASGLALVAVLALAIYIQRGAGESGQARSTSQPAIVAFTLTAIGERSAAASSGFDRVNLPATATAVRLTVQPSNLPAEGEATAEIAAVDLGTTLQLASPDVTLSGPAVTVTVATTDLPDGDYILTTRHVVGNQSIITARQAFRVTRQPR